MKPYGRRLITALALFIFSFVTTFFIIGGFVLGSCHHELKENLDRSLERLAEDIIFHRLYELDHSQIYKELHLIDLSNPMYENLTFAYHPTKPKPIIGTGVIKKLPDGRYLTVYSSLKHVDAKTFALAKKLLMLFTALLVLFSLVFALFIKKRDVSQK